MAKDDKKDAKEGEGKAEASPEEAAAKSKKKKLIILIAGGVLLTAAIGGGAAFFLASGKPKDADKAESAEAAPSGGESEGAAEPAASEGTAEAADVPAKAGEEAPAKGAETKDGQSASTGPRDIGGFGCTMGFTPPFNVNLRNALGNHYMRLEIAVEYACSDEEAKNELTQRMPQLRDAVISVASNKSREFLLGPDGMDQLRRDLQNRINHFMTRKIKSVYITDILIE